MLQLPPPLDDPGFVSGDLVAVRVVGLSERAEELRVNGDGTVDAPYVGRLRVAGLDARGVARVLRARLEALGILQEVRVEVAAARSDWRGIAMLGRVVRPCLVQLAPGVTVTRALASAGGFLDPADHTVLLVRRARTGMQTFAIPVDEIAAGRLLDVPLGPRDTILVSERASAPSSL